MYKLFINNKVVFLCQNPAFVENLMNDNFIVLQYKNKTDFEAILQMLLGDANQSNLVLFSKDVDAMFSDVCSFFECIEAAGGVVSNTDGEILLIYRRGFWDLPKGKIEQNETIEHAAIREVEEETGIGKLNIIQPIHFKNLKNKATYHSYLIKNKPALKVSYWFDMQTTFSGQLVPQTEEDIEQVVWVSPHELPNYFDTMYPSIIDVLKEII